MRSDVSSRLPIFFIVMTVVIDAMGIGLIMPVMPDMIKEVLGVGLADAAVWGGILAASFAAMQFLFGPFLGNLSDRYGPGFDAWRDEMDAVGMSDPLTRFSELVAEPDEVGLDVAESLATEQEPMVPVFLEWWHRAPDRVDSLVWDVFSTTRLKQTPARLDVTVSGWEGDGYIGLLGAYDDDGDSMLGLLLDSAGNVSTFDVSGGEVLWADVDAVTAPGRSVVLSLTHEGGEAVFTVDGESVRIPISYAAAAGLAVYDARVLFSEITWD